MHARNHHSNQHHQQAGYFVSLKNDNYATTHEKRITDSGRVVDSSNGALFHTKNTRTETTTSFPVNDTSIQQEELPVSSPHVVHAQGESTSLLGASPFKMTVLFAAASSVGNKNQDKNATTQGENKASTTTEETRQDKAHPSRRRRKSKKTPKPTFKKNKSWNKKRRESSKRAFSPNNVLLWKMPTLLVFKHLLQNNGPTMTRISWTKSTLASSERVKPIGNVVSGSS
jgi:hypothetical protein